MEKLHQQLYFYLKNNKILYENQFDFRNKHSTTHALIKFTEKIREALHKKRFVCDIFIDEQKSFNTANHDILIAKLKYPIE